MKKLLTLSLFCSVAIGASAATYLSEDFESLTFPSLWTQQTNATDGGWKVGSAASLSSTYLTVPENGSAGIIGTNDDACNCNKSNDLLITEPVDLSTATAPALFFESYFGGFTYGGGTEEAHVLVSTDGSNWTTLEAIAPGAWTQTAIDLSNYIGQSTVFVGFKYNDDGVWSFGCMLDDIEIKDIPALDASASSITMSNIGLSGASVPVKGVLHNLGTSTITSVDVVWSDGVNQHSETLNGLNIASLETYSFEHSTLFTLEPGTNTLNVWTENPNASTDENMSNDQASIEIEGVVASPGRKVVQEEGTGTWCGWCPRGAVLLEQMVHRYPDLFIPIAVHNGDPMTVTEYDDGLDFSGFPSMSNERTEEYGFGIVEHIEAKFLDRIQMSGKASLISSGDYNSTTRELTVTSTATALENFSGQYKMAVVLIEDGVKGTSAGYGQTNYYAGGSEGPMGGYENLPSTVPASQMVYDHVGRVLIGSFNGVNGSVPSSMTQGESANHTFDAVTIPSGYNTDSMHVVTLLLNSSGHIINANDQTFDEVISIPVGIAKSEEFNLTLFPNPSNEAVYLSLNLKEASSVELSVFNSLGQYVDGKRFASLSGNQTLLINENALPTGFYTVKVKVNQTVYTKHFSIVE